MFLPQFPSNYFSYSYINYQISILTNKFILCFFEKILTVNCKYKQEEDLHGNTT